MKHVAVLVCAAILAMSAPAYAGFGGQTILGPLVSGSSVNGDTSVGATDDNDGFTSGDHFFFIWNGPDDVYAIDWLGGDLEVELLYDTFETDLDLFLYTPGSLDDSAYYSIINTGVENIQFPAGAPGTYYVVIDSEVTGGAYTLNVVPEPATAALLGLGLTLVARRRRQ